MSTKDNSELTQSSNLAVGIPPGGTPSIDPGNDADGISSQVIQDLRSLSPDDPDGFLVEMIDLFQTDASAYLARIEESAKTANASALKKSAHGLKGSSGNLGAQKMSALCNQIEIAASEGAPDWNKINPLVTSMIGEAARVRRAFDQLRIQAIRPK